MENRSGALSSAMSSPQWRKKTEESVPRERNHISESMTKMVCTTKKQYKERDTHVTFSYEWFPGLFGLEFFILTEEAEMHASSQKYASFFSGRLVCEYFSTKVRSLFSTKKKILVKAFKNSWSCCRLFIYLERWWYPPHELLLIGKDSLRTLFFQFCDQWRSSDAICKGYRCSLGNYQGLNPWSYLKHFEELIIQKPEFKISCITL